MNTAINYAEIGVNIFAAWNAGNEFPDAPLFTCDLSEDEHLTVFRHGIREGTGRARVRRARRGVIGAKYADVEFSWQLLQDAPEAAVHLIANNARFTLDRIGEAET
jgi:hypothetical protein